MLGDGGVLGRPDYFRLGEEVEELNEPGRLATAHSGKERLGGEVVGTYLVPGAE